MMDQMCIDTMVSEEQKAYEIVYPEINDIIFNAPIDSGILIFQEIGNCSSVYFLDANEIFFRVRLRKKSRYILIPQEYEDLLPNDTVVSKAKSDAGMLRITIQAPEDILRYVPILRDVLDRICRKHRDFGCCGRYEECSNEKRCVHPDPKYALGCWYHKNLLDGKIFYGKNRNID